MYRRTPLKQIGLHTAIELYYTRNFTISGDIVEYQLQRENSSNTF